MYDNDPFNGTSFRNNDLNKCHNCGMIFSSQIALQNHITKFCVDSGFDTLAGLNIRLQHPAYRHQKKLTKKIISQLDQINNKKPFLPIQRQLTHQILSYNRHKEELQNVRPYYHRSAQKSSNMRQSKSKSLYTAGNLTLQKQTPNEDNQRKLQYKEDNKISYHNSNISNYKRTYEQQNSYISPPTQLKPLERVKQPLERVKQSMILNRSDISIKNMPQQEKRQYVIAKLLQLQNIQQTYKKNGGKNQDFIKNTTKMILFYKNLLQNVNNHQNSKFGHISNDTINDTRPTTPISKLHKLTDSKLNQSIFNQRQSKLAEIKFYNQNKNLQKRQENTRKKLHSQLGQSSNALNEQMIKKANRNNQVIVIPINQPSNTSTSNPTNDIALKYLQELMKLKNQQSQKLINIIQKQNNQVKKMYQIQAKAKQKQNKMNTKKIQNLQKKYKNLIQNQSNIQPQSKIQYENRKQEHPNNKYRISRSKTEYSQNPQPQQYINKEANLKNVRKLKLQQSGHYMNNNQQLSRQQKILLQMQKQQRDQLQLFSNLPNDLQKIKLQSIKQISQQRYQMQKQIMKQKIQKLRFKQSLESFQNQRKLVNQDIQSQKRKLGIQKLIKTNIKHFIQKQYIDSLTSDQDNSNTSQDQNQMLQQNQMLISNQNLRRNQQI